jgi:DNA-nicking Smr family endonuclease
MPDKPKISEADRRLFREAARGARRLEHDRHVAHKPRPGPSPRQSRLDEARVLDDMFSDHLDPAELETGDELLYLRPGLQQSLLRKLRRGHYSVGAELDLHGRTSDEARADITGFLRECRHLHLRCVRIIHGKGHGSRHKLPVLKNKVNAWLRQRDEVLAFCSARPVDGGTGAVYVLLKGS